MPFKFDSASFFLTYPQSGELTQDDIVNHLQSITTVLWLRIARELHEDGSPHYHVVGKFTRRYQSRNERVFDVAGKHPNIQSIRSVAKALQYVSKDGQFTDIGAVPSTEDSETDWLALAQQLSEGDYFRAAMQAKVSYMYADRFWKMARARASTEIGESYEADLTRECFELLVHQPSEVLSTVVVGPTGCGKTSWAKRVATKPALWVRHMDMLRAFRPDYHQSIIFDDMSFKHLPRETQIQITDSYDEQQLHVRYGVAIIPPKVMKIFTANEYPFIVDPAVDRRVYKIEVQGINP